VDVYPSIDRRIEMKRLLSAVLILSMVMLSGCSGEVKPADKNAQGKDELEVKVVQGISDTTIKVGTLAPLTGSTSTIGLSVLHGMQAYFNKVNDAGGIYGRKIELVSKDDQLNQDLAQKKAEELVEKDKVFAIVGQLGTSGCLATADYFKEKGIPCIYQGTGNSAFSQLKGNYFPVQPNYIVEGNLIAKYAVGVLKAKKIAIIYSDDNMGKDELQGVQSELKKMEKDSILMEPIPFNPGDVDFSAQVRKASYGKPDVTIISAMQKQTLGVILEASKQDFKSQFMGSYICADLSVLSIAKENINGMILPGWIPDITDVKNADTKDFIETCKRYFPGETANAYTAAGYIAAQVFVEGLKRTDNNNLTWDGFIKGMESVNSFNCLAKGITYTADRRNGAEKMYFMKAKYTDDKNMKFQIVSDFYGLEDSK
jgi:branched-chain amino acid transport system substrate-binding protein